ncbi:MAG: SDR family NAD(P)-dependent oxidoreductase [Desulfurococcaceae archaeon]
MKIAVVTGASRGIGRSIVYELHNRGWFILGVARSRESLEELRRELGERFEYVTVDLSKVEDVYKVVDYVRDKFCKIDLLINNAGAGLYKSVLEHSVDDIVNLTMLNMVSPIVLTKELVPYMVEGSTIVFVVTVAIHVAFSKLPIYGASKLALHYVIKILRKELEKKKINVIGIYPGYVKTSFHEKAGYRDVGRGLSPEAVAKTVVKAIEKGKKEVYVPSYFKIIKFIEPYLPVI